MIFRQVRNASFLLDYAGQRFLIDPVLGEKGAMEEGAIPLGELLDVDAVIATHLSGNCFDQEARRLIPRGMKIFVQDDAVAQELDANGFFNLEVLTDHTRWQYVELHKTPAFQGMSGNSMPNRKRCGVMITHPVLNSTYIVGDSIWNDGLKDTIHTWKPRLIIVNAGGNVRSDGRRITMNQEEIAAVHLTMPKAKIIATRTDKERGNTLSRSVLKEYVWEHRLQKNVLIPEDGEEYRL